MNNYYSPSKEYEIDPKNLLWKLLMQWKAVMIVCILMAIFLSGVKYIKDSKEYDASLAEKKLAEQEASLPEDERIAQILEALPSDEVSAVQFILKMQEMLDLQNDYLNTSILLNTNPTSQRNLRINYNLQKGSVTDLQMLVDSYSSYFRSAKVMESLRDAVSPEAPLEHMYDLISIYSGNIVDSSASGTLLTVNVVLPESIDADKIIAIVDSSISNVNDQLNSILGEHNIERVNVEDYHAYSNVATDKRINSINVISNLTNYIINAKARLTDSQAMALESITAIKNGTSVAENSPSSSNVDVSSRPGIDKKYAILGFVFGLFLYAAVFVICLIMKKSIYSASTAQAYSGARLIGELYRFDDHKGIRNLFSSKALVKRKQQDLIDVPTQANIVSNNVEATCSHNNVNALTLLMNGITDDFADIVEILEEKCKANCHNIKIDKINADDLNEKQISDINNAIFVLSNNSKVDKVGKLSSLCRDYDVSALGTIYMENL